MLPLKIYPSTYVETLNLYRLQKPLLRPVGEICWALWQLDPIMPGELCHPKLDGSVCQLRDVWCILFFFRLRTNTSLSYANSVCPDQTPRFAAPGVWSGSALFANVPCIYIVDWFLLLLLLLLWWWWWFLLLFFIVFLPHRLPRDNKRIWNQQAGIGSKYLSGNNLPWIKLIRGKMFPDRNLLHMTAYWIQ